MWNWILGGRFATVYPKVYKLNKCILITLIRRHTRSHTRTDAAGSGNVNRKRYRPPWRPVTHSAIKGCAEPRYGAPNSPRLPPDKWISIKWKRPLLMSGMHHCGSGGTVAVIECGHVFGGGDVRGEYHFCSVSERERGKRDCNCR